ncbi:MAG: ankyrin repeat domain-containing protein [Elusimicrobia bacterium]|nr:ankyrin repeat domain-containing protein [Elusimicrobiota bacterium]
MRTLLPALLLAAVLPSIAAAKDPLMDALGDPAKVAELLKERKPKTAHLQEALRSGSTGSVHLLLAAGVKVPSADEDQLSLLKFAMQRGTETVKRLLAAGVRADVSNKGNMTSQLTYHSGCPQGRENPALLEVLLDGGASPNAHPKDVYDGPLYRAAGECCMKHFELLIKRGAKLQPAPSSVCPEAARGLLASGYPFDSDWPRAGVRGDTQTLRLVLESSPTLKIGPDYIVDGAVDRALFEVERPDPALADLIVSRGVAFESPWCLRRVSLARAAASPALTPALRWLLAYPGGDPVSCVREGEVPLETALAAGNREAVKLLLSHPGHRGLMSGGRPPLHRVACDPELLDWALKHGADPEQADAERGLTPLTYLTSRHSEGEKDCGPESLEALLAAGAKLDAPDAKGYTALTRLLEGPPWPRPKPSEPLLAALLKHKPDLSLRSGRKEPPLTMALEWPDVVKRLLAAGADPNQGDGARDEAPLAGCAVRPDCSLESAQALLAGGARIDRPDQIGFTALTRAAEQGNAKMVSWLLAKGADPLWQDNSQKTPYDHAKGAETLNILRSASARGKPAAPTPDVHRLVDQAVAAAAAREKKAAVAVAPPAAAPALVSDADKPGYALPEDPDAFAIVVGVEEYSELPKALFAERDAAAVRRHLKALGVPERNLILLSGAKAGRSALAKYLESWLPKNANERSRVFFYFSGHGAPDPSTGRAFLMPWDGDASFLADTAYPVDRLYKTLDGLKAKQVVVLLDACFSGAGGRSVLSEGARPLVSRLQKPATGRLSVLAATQPDQITSVLKEQGHGLFTYHLLKGLSAGGPVTTASLHSYLKPKVQDEARRQNRDQTPSLSGPEDVLLRAR